MSIKLLPKETKEFGSKDYWEKFFSNRCNDPFEWYGEFAELYTTFHPYLRLSDDILVAGCGNSTLSADLYKLGYKKITSADVSEVVIKQMSGRYRDSCPDMRWCREDLTNSSFCDAAFSVVIDKGTLDALYTDDSETAREIVDKYLNELHRVLRVGGRYILVSLLQKHIVKRITEWCATTGLLLRLTRCEEAEKAAKSEGRFTLPVFVVICTKLNPMPGMNPVFENCLGRSGVGPTRVAAEELLQQVLDVQQYSVITHSLLNKVSAGEEARLELCSATTENLRYILFVLDASRSTAASLPMAVFIVPQRREVEWLFSTKEGRQQLMAIADAGRFIVVHLVRGQTYEDGLQQVQDELSACIADLKPSTLPKAFKIPFLSVGSDVGRVTRVFSGNSGYCGDFVVEDVVVDDGTTLRRLVFLDNPNVIQSEVRLRHSVHSKKKTPKSTLSNLDHGYLSCSHHLAMVASLGLVRRDASVLLLGVGGGPLATYLHNNFPRINVCAVELDPAMVAVAQQWFGFKSGPRLSVIVMDALDYCASAAQQEIKYDVILLDVDSKDPSVGMSCPPQAFVEEDFLRVMASCLLPGGVLTMNIVCRDTSVWSEVVKKVSKVYGRTLCQSVPHEVNRVLFCRILHQETCSVLNDSLSALGFDNEGRSTESAMVDIQLSDDAVRVASALEVNQNNSETACIKPKLKNCKSSGKLSNKRKNVNMSCSEMYTETKLAETDEEMYKEFTKSLERMNKVLRSKNNGKNLFDIKEVLQCTIVL